VAVASCRVVDAAIYEFGASVSFLSGSAHHEPCSPNAARTNSAGVTHTRRAQPPHRREARSSNPERFVIAISGDGISVEMAHAAGARCDVSEARRPCSGSHAQKKELWQHVGAEAGTTR
jgi:hypothetical protein